MSKYTYEDIIINPSDPRLEGAIGKECYSNDNPSLLLNYANEGIGLTRLKFIWAMDSEYPFTTEKNEELCSYSCPCIILKKEKSSSYKPFDLSKKEVRDKLRGQWIVDKNEKYQSEYMIIKFGYTFNGETTVSIKGTYMTAEHLLKFYTFLDGTPCGEPLEEDEA